MSLNKYILRKENEEIIFEKIHRAIKTAFLTKKGKEFKYKKGFWIEDLIKIIAERENMKKNTVRKCIETLIKKNFISLKEKNEVYCDHEFLENIRALNIDIFVSERQYEVYLIGRKLEKKMKEKGIILYNE